MSNNSNLLEEVLRCVEVIGYDKTLETLKKAQHQEIVFEDNRVKIVVEMVSRKMNIPVFEILFGNGRKNERKYAIGLCAYYLHDPQYYGIDMEVVKNFLNRDSNVICYKYAKMITKLNPNHITDKSIYNIKKQLDTELSKTIK